ncbi:MAG: DegV family protein, partial [Acidimicrobiales bacterium]
MTIGLCTDSNAQMPAELVARYGVAVVPLTVVIDGRSLLEGEELEADAFYAAMAASPPPSVTTAAPSPGRFVAAYQALAGAGATAIVSVHIGSAISGTLNSARVAADLSPVPVHLVDTGTASFAVACCVWEAAEALARGAGADEAARVAGEVAGCTDNVFVVKALDLARAGGRLSRAAGGAVDGGAIPVLRLVDGIYRAVAQVHTVADAAEVMAGAVLAGTGPGGGTRLRVGISIADAAAAPLWQALEDRLAGRPEIADLVRYRVGPSVGVHT